MYWSYYILESFCFVDGFVTREEFDQALKFLPKEIFT